FLIFDVENYVYKLTEKECKPKYYYADNGLLNLFVTNRDSALLENIVAIDMHRKYDELLHYVKGKCEVDFYVPEIETAVQVAYSLNDDQTYKREIDGLKTLHKTWNLKQAIIVTYEESGEIQEGDLKIKIMPASEYLL
ncbi:MAG: ATP-binding protein, partial [Alphaproteobacteria bacterium]|nr:ATP-binding protein [Alphaproteobacteria bacterium]